MLKNNLSPRTKIDRPIFVIGCGRSGSTLLYNMLCAHPDLAWFSNFTARFPHRLFLAKFSKLYPFRLGKNYPKYVLKAIPKPSEGYELWDLARPVVDSPSDPPLSHEDATPEDQAHIEAIISQHLKYQNGQRFINKNTRNTRRMGYLDTLFPEALFIHIVRDPRASVASLLKVDWWPDLKVWNQGQITPAEWAQQGNNPAVLAAELWRDETKLVLENRKALSDRYYRVRYKDLIANPQETVGQLSEFCELPANERFAQRLEMFKIRDMNYKYKVDLSSEQQEIVKDITAPMFAEMGYGYS